MATATAIRRAGSSPRQRGQSQQHARKLLQNEIKFIYSDEFKSMSVDDDRLQPFEGLSAKVQKSKSKAGLFEPLACLESALNETLLTSRAEQHEFRRMNFFRFAANRLRSTLNPQRPSKRCLAEIERFLSLAASAREIIIRANLRLVVSNAGKYCSHLYGFEELFSDGVLSLMEAVDKFDYSRGFRFSTYATHCIRRSFYRRMERQHKDRRRFSPTDPEILYATPDNVETADDQQAHEEQLVAQLMEQFDDCLSDRERRIIEGRFGLGDRTRSYTLLELSGELGICKERVRQVEHRAIEKLRLVADRLQHQRSESAEALSA